MKVVRYNPYWNVEYFSFARNKNAKKAHGLLRKYEETKKHQDFLEAFLRSQLPEGSVC